MTGWEAVLVVLAGVGAGGVNALIGSGSLITFPTLLAVGYAPVTANVSNNIGVLPGSISGSIGFRRELEGQGSRARTLAAASALGGLTGAILLLALPSDVFDAVVPVLVLPDQEIAEPEEPSVEERALMDHRCPRDGRGDRVAVGVVQPGGRELGPGDGLDPPVAGRELVEYPAFVCSAESRRALEHGIGYRTW